MHEVKKYINRIHLYFRHRSETLSFFGMNQYVDWHIIVSLTAVLMLTIIVVTGSIYIYTSQISDAFDITPEVVTKSPIQEDAIKKVLEQYEQKVIDFAALKEAPYTYPNPEE